MDGTGKRGWMKPMYIHHLQLIRVNRVKWCLWFIALISFHLNWLLDHSSIWLNDTLNWNQKSKWNYIKLISTKWNYDGWILSIYLLEKLKLGLNEIKRRRKKCKYHSIAEGYCIHLTYINEYQIRCKLGQFIWYFVFDTILWKLRD